MYKKIAQTYYIPINSATLFCRCWEYVVLSGGLPTNKLSVLKKTSSIKKTKINKNVNFKVKLLNHRMKKKKELRINIISKTYLWI